MLELARPDEAAVVERSREEPCLSFSEYGIALHFAAWRGRDDGSVATAWSKELGSFERDVLSYAYRNRPPFFTHVLALPEELRRVTAVFPADVEYTSEGRDVRLRCAGLDGDGVRRRPFRLMASRTDFTASGLSVLHVVLGPQQRDGADGVTRPESELNEFDVIKLIKLWEGGEELRDPEVGDARPGWVRFVDARGHELTHEHLARRLLAGVLDDGGRLLPRVVGTVQLLTPLCSVDADVSLCEGVARLRDGFFTSTRIKSDEHARLWRHLVATGGFVQGLLDFAEVDADELLEAFEPVAVDAESMLAIRMGTIFSMAAEDRLYRATQSSVGISPYLLVTHAVLLHNEACLIEALDTAAAAVAPDRSLRDVTDDRTRIHRIMDEYLLPNVFHYPQERTLYDAAYASRDLARHEQTARNRLLEIKANIDDRVRTRREWSEDAISVLLLLLAGLEISSIVPLQIVIPVLTIVAVAFFVSRRLL